MAATDTKRAMGLKNAVDLVSFYVIKTPWVVDNNLEFQNLIKSNYDWNGARLKQGKKLKWITRIRVEARIHGTVIHGGSPVQRGFPVRVAVKILKRSGVTQDIFKQSLILLFGSHLPCHCLTRMLSRASSLHPSRSSLHPSRSSLHPSRSHAPRGL
jgi:hypothetical protein